MAHSPDSQEVSGQCSKSLDDASILICTLLAELTQPGFYQLMGLKDIDVLKHGFSVFQRPYFTNVQLKHVFRGYEQDIQLMISGLSPQVRIKLSASTEGGLGITYDPGSYLIQNENMVLLTMPAHVTFGEFVEVSVIHVELPDIEPATFKLRVLEAVMASAIAPKSRVLVKTGYKKEVIIEGRFDLTATYTCSFADS